MTVKGYYPSVSLGFEILIAIINSLAGTALLAFGVIFMLSEISQILHLVLIGAAAVPGGLLALAAGILAITGSCKESVGSLRSAYILSIISLLAVGGVAGYAFASAGGLSESARRSWFKLSDESKKLIEIKYACCGFSANSEKTDGCEPEQICSEPLLADVGKQLKILGIIAAAVAAIQLPAILCGCCVWGTMRSQQEHKRRKQGLSLEAEAHGGYKHSPGGSKKKKGGKSKDGGKAKRGKA